MADIREYWKQMYDMQRKYLTKYLKNERKWVRACTWSIFGYEYQSNNDNYNMG